LWMEQERDKPKVGTHLFKGQELHVSGQRSEIIQQALLEVERGFRETEPQEAAKPRYKEQKMENEQPIDWERHVQERREELRSQRRKVQQEYEKQFKQFYARAVKLYRNGSYEEAKALFLQIEQMKPGYKRAASYLKKAEAKIRKGLQRKSNRNVVLQPQEIKTRNNTVEEVLNDLE